MTQLYSIIDKVTICYTFIIEIPSFLFSADLLYSLMHFSGLELYPEVMTCLQSTVLHWSVQSTLHKWDTSKFCNLSFAVIKPLIYLSTEFQGVIANNCVMRQRGYKAASSTFQSQEVLLSQVCEDLNKKFIKNIEKLHHDLKRSSNVLLHIEIMKEVSVLSNFVQMVLHHISIEFLWSVGRNMHQWNITNLAWLISCGTPALCSGAKKCVVMVQYMTCPRLSFPVTSFFHCIERQCQMINESIHHSFTFIKVG